MYICTYISCSELIGREKKTKTLETKKCDKLNGRFDIRTHNPQIS